MKISVRLKPIERKEVPEIAEANELTQHPVRILIDVQIMFK